MTSYVVEGEALNAVYDIIDLLPLGTPLTNSTLNKIDDFITIGIPLATNMSSFKGEVIPLPKQEGGAIHNHLINSVINALS